MRSSRLILLVGIAGLLGLPDLARADIIETQAFDTPAAAAAAGWTGFRNTLDGNDFGFRTSNHAGGLSPAGEAGGRAARTANLSYYADITLARRGATGPETAGCRRGPRRRAVLHHRERGLLEAPDPRLDRRQRGLS